jgi:Na+-transporting methylmalonyl-CoA/oxaloacetate decarboxylase gamma subunit
MNELIAALKEGPILNKAFFVMAAGMLGVFLVLVVFYFSIKFLERAFRSGDAGDSEQT